MGLIADLLGAIGGKKGASRTISDVETALARLADERAKAREAVARAMRQRDELLLVDETDARIAALDATADRRRLTLERCDAAEPLLLRELQQLRTEAKRAGWGALRTRYDEASVAYAAALRTAVERQAAMLNVNAEARRLGFEREVMAAFVPPTRMISVEALNEFETAIERAREMGRPAPASAPAPAPKAAAPPPPAKPKAAAASPKPPPKPFTPPAPDANGDVEIVRKPSPAFHADRRAPASCGCGKDGRARPSRSSSPRPSRRCRGSSRTGRPRPAQTTAAHRRSPSRSRAPCSRPGRSGEPRHNRPHSQAPATPRRPE